MDLQGQHGLLTTHHRAWARTSLRVALSALLVSFYLVLYFSDWLTPTARVLGLRSKWFLYGALYTAVMTLGAVRYLRLHGNSRYNRLRIAVNLGVQVALAFALPFVMPLFSSKPYYFSYLWPLKIEALYPRELSQYPVYVAAYSVLASLLLLPLLTLRYGKRFYCSWVCGCGGLANTFGDPFRHLTSKSERAHRFEKWSVHTTLAVAVFTTLVVLADFSWGGEQGGLSSFALVIRRSYGLVVGAVLSGVIGVGVYPLLGPRFWCRNFCPMAALLGLVQLAGRFRIRVRPDVCISCGNCSTYCEMGIDVRAYAERGESFTRAACVGCGACAHVCPRGVLKLENAPSGSKAKRALKVL